MPFGTGAYQYEVIEKLGQTARRVAVRLGSRSRLRFSGPRLVYSRSEHPLVVFDSDGNFLASWGEDVIEDAHGIFIDGEDNVWCTERETHCIFKFNTQGELVMTIGTPGKEGAPGNPSASPPTSPSPPTATSSSPTATTTPASTNTPPPASTSSPGATGVKAPASSHSPLRPPG